MFSHLLRKHLSFWKIVEIHIVTEGSVEFHVHTLGSSFWPQTAQLQQSHLLANCMPHSSMQLFSSLQIYMYFLLAPPAQPSMLWILSHHRFQQRIAYGDKKQWTQRQKKHRWRNTTVVFITCQLANLLFIVQITSHQMWWMITPTGVMYDHLNMKGYNQGRFNHTSKHYLNCII